MAGHIDGRRRTLLKSAGAALTGLTLCGLPGILRGRQAPAVIAADAARPVGRWGLQTGEVQGDRALVWSRADRPARMSLEWSLRPDFSSSQRVVGTSALAQADFIGRATLSGLPPGRELFLRLEFESLETPGARSEPLVGSLRTPPADASGLRFVWGGDTAGQGWGIDLASGGMRSYETMRQRRPLFFLHSGDTVYADGPMSPQVETAYGTWTNAFLDAVPEKTRVAQTLHEFRRQYLYNLYDEHLRRFNAEVPQVWQWDDHEVLNNWSPGKDLSGDTRYTEKNIHRLAAHARRAFLEYAPMHGQATAARQRIYRRLSYGRHLDLFVLDMRSYRAANSANLQCRPNQETRYLGEEQRRWLKRALQASRATWKVIAADMPLGLQIGDGKDQQGRPRWEASSNGDGPVLGREWEIADLLSFINHAGIRNTVWLTADVHYCAAHYYDPGQARFSDFHPFWEFVAGPLHAGTFGPNALDDSFGPQLMFQKTPPPGQLNLPPSAGMQFFGQVDIDGASGAMTVALVDRAGTPLFSKLLLPS